MAPLAGDELAAVLGAADAETVAGFVADLHEARGRHVERDGAALAVHDAGDETRVVVAGSSANPATADAVVVTGRDATGLDVGGARRVDAAELAETLLYAVDRDTAESLLERWFDRTFDDFEGTDGTPRSGPGGSSRTPAGAPARGTAGGAGPTAGDAARTAGDAGPGSQRRGAGSRRGAAGSPPGRGEPEGRERRFDEPLRAVAVALGLVLVAVALAGALPTVTGPAGDWPATTGETTADGEDWQVFDAPDDRYSTREKVGANEPTPTGAPRDRAELPPGVSPSGEIDEMTLLDAHASVLRSDSYRVSVTHREFVDGRETGTYVQSVAVENATTYRVRTIHVGTFRDGPVRLDDGDVYADGTTRYERVSGGVNVEQVVGDDPFVEDMVRYMRYYLSVEASRIADARTLNGTTFVYLRTTGDPWPGVQNATGSAVVTEDGLVRTVRRTYDDPESEAHVVITIRVADVGRTNATAPWWVPDEDGE